MAMKIFLALLVVALPLSAGVGTWTPIGPDGGNVGVLAVNPADPDVVYAAPSFGLFKSTDAGATWADSSRGIEDRIVTALLVRPGAVVFAGTQDGILFKSTNGGATWARSFQGLAPAPPQLGPGISSLLTDPRKPGRIWMGTRRGLYASTDNGATWFAPSQGEPFNNPVMGIAIDPRNGHLFISSLRRGVYSSTNQGKSWFKASRNLVGGSYGDLVLDPRNSSILHVVNSTGLWRSESRGGRWKRVPGLTSISALVYQGNRLYAASTLLGIFYSDDQGKTWTSAPESPEDLLVLDLAASSQALYAGTTGLAAPSGVYRSLDRGLTWNASNHGLHAQNVNALAVSPVDSDLLYANASNEGVFQSSDRGATWEHLRQLDPRAYPAVRTMALDRSNTVFLAAGPGRDGRSALLRSRDGGTSWNTSPELQLVVVNDLEADPFVAGTMWAAGGTLPQGTAALYRSDDSGANWTFVEVPGSTLQEIEVDPTNHQVLWVAGVEAGETRIYRSPDRGATWERRDTSFELPDPYRMEDLAIDPADPNRLYAATQAGLYFTPDAGLNWYNIRGTSFTEVEVSPTAVYIYAPDSGVFRSTDTAVHWSLINGNVVLPPVLDMALDPVDPRRLYVGTLGRSVFSYEEP